jgi:cysteine desulfurase
LTLFGADAILNAEDFRIAMRIYLDHNATTPVDREVLEAMLPYFSDAYGNASSIHSDGQQARAAVERARESVAALVGARPADIVFTSGGTEADNLAILGVVAAARGEKKHLITSQIEHHAVLNACQALERQGVAVTYLPVGGDGLVDPDEVFRALRAETVLISVMHANNEIGSIQPIEEISRIAAEADVYFHTDAVQSVGKLPVEVNRLGVDLLSISAHKLYGPKGVGALYVRSGTALEPQFFGGHHERDRRPGTENVPGIVGLGKAAEIARVRLAAEPNRIAELRNKLEAGLLASVPQTRVNGSREHRVPNTTNLTFSFADGEAMVIALDLKGLACSTGAACSSGAIEPSHVLKAIGLADEDARASLRFSLGRSNTNAEIDAALELIPHVVEHLRDLSPVYRKAVAIQ